jgi:hypothetical protein
MIDISTVSSYDSLVLTGENVYKVAPITSDDKRVVIPRRTYASQESYRNGVRYMRITFTDQDTIDKIKNLEQHFEIEGWSITYRISLAEIRCNTSQFDRMCMSISAGAYYSAIADRDIKINFIDLRDIAWKYFRLLAQTELISDVQLEILSLFLEFW